MRFFFYFVSKQGKTVRKNYRFTAAAARLLAGYAKATGATESAVVEALILKGAGILRAEAKSKLDAIENLPRGK